MESRLSPREKRFCLAAGIMIRLPRHKSNQRGIKGKGETKLVKILISNGM